MPLNVEFPLGFWRFVFDFIADTQKGRVAERILKCGLAGGRLRDQTLRKSPRRL